MTLLEFASGPGLQWALWIFVFGITVARCGRSVSVGKKGHIEAAAHEPIRTDLAQYGPGPPRRMRLSQRFAFSMSPAMPGTMRYCYLSAVLRTAHPVLRVGARIQLAKPAEHDHSRDRGNCDSRPDCAADPPCDAPGTALDIERG